MAFIETIAPSESEGDVRAMYERQQASYGYVPNYAKVFSHRPEVLARWGRLLAEIRRPMDDRRFELATYAAALELRHTACALAHGTQLARFLPEADVLSLADGEGTGVLDATEAEIFRFARKVARDASAVTARDVDALKRHGLTDAEVFDVAAAAAGRAFFTKLLDALGVEADSENLSLSESFRTTLTFARPISEDPPEVVDRASR